MRSRPRASAASMARTDVLGLAMKNLLRLTDAPAVLPPDQEGPDESWRSAGTNTLNVPSEPSDRNGSSWVTGLVATVVYGLVPPKLWGGAPGSPTKTWFQ